MSKKLPVIPLQDLALEQLAKSIVEVIVNEIQRDHEMDMALVIVEIASYLEAVGTTSVVYQELLNVILKSEEEAVIRFCCLQMLLNESVQHLTTEAFPLSYYEKVLQTVAIQGRGLKLLDLRGIWIKEEHMFYVHDILKNLPNLTTLIIPYNSTDELLHWIAEYNPKLRVLDISGESDITEDGLETLAYSLAREHLTVVDIGSLGEENIAHEDISLLLLNLPNLMNLKSYSYVGRSIKYILDQKQHDFKCKLKYLHDTDTSIGTIDAIIKCCPNLESLYLDAPSRGVISKIKAMKLTKLKLCKFDCAELYPAIESMGQYLVNLILIKGHGTLEIGKLITFCPGLTNLEFYTMDMLSYTSDKCFDRLQSLQMLSSPLQVWSLKYLICNAPTLKRLAVDRVELTDEDMSYILLEQDFQHLDTIWFTEAQNLTMATCEILMERCPELQFIGDLSGWNLTPDDVILLNGILKSKNSCIILTLGGLAD